MDERRALAQKFVETWQLNVPERRSLNDQPLPGSLVSEAIASIVRQHGSYPRERLVDDGFDGGLLESVPEDRCRTYWKVESGVGRFELQEVEYFETVAEGAVAYGRRFFGVNFDGIAIDWTT